MPCKLHQCFGSLHFALFLLSAVLHVVCSVRLARKIFHDFASSWWCLSDVYLFQPQKINNFWANLRKRRSSREKTQSVLTCDVGASHPLPPVIILNARWTWRRFSLAELTIFMYSVASRLPHMLFRLPIGLIPYSFSFLLFLFLPLCSRHWLAINCTRCSSLRSFSIYANHWRWDCVCLCGWVCCMRLNQFDLNRIDLKKASLFGSVPYASCMQYPRTRILHADARVTPTENFFDVSEDRDY